MSDHLVVVSNGATWTVVVPIAVQMLINDQCSTTTCKSTQLRPPSLDKASDGRCHLHSNCRLSVTSQRARAGCKHAYQTSEDAMCLPTLMMMMMHRSGELQTGIAVCMQCARDGYWHTMHALLQSPSRLAAAQLGARLYRLIQHQSRDTHAIVHISTMVVMPKFADCSHSVAGVLLSELTGT